MERFFWHGLAGVGVKSPWGGLFWQKCVGIMNEVVNK